jgi:hypothetical protein
VQKVVLLIYGGYLLRLFFDCEDGCDVCLRNIMLLRTVRLNNPEDRTFNVHDVQVCHCSVRKRFESFRLKFVWNGVSLTHVF